MPFETVMPDFNGALLYAMGEVGERLIDIADICVPIRVPIPCGPANPTP